MSFWHDIPKPIIGLSPMDGVTDASFRLIAARHGRPDITVTEFVNVAALRHAPPTLIRDFSYAEIERPVIAQIYGRTPELFYQAAHVVCELGFDGLDINMGCPAKNVAASGCGAALIRTPELARSILKAARQGIEDWCAGQSLEDLELGHDLIARVRIANESRAGAAAKVSRRTIPLSIKTRIGYDEIVVENWLQTLLEERPAAVSIHGRTLKQGYKGNADWDAIARAVKIAERSDSLILGNGDLRSMGDVYRRVRESGVDGVLLGRAVQGNPWIFRAKHRLKQALQFPEGSPIVDQQVDLNERFRVMAEHADHFQTHGQTGNFVGMRKHLIWYCRDFRGAAELRARMARVDSAAEVIRCLGEYRVGLDPQAPLMPAAVYSDGRHLEASAAAFQP